MKKFFFNNITKGNIFFYIFLSSSVLGVGISYSKLYLFHICLVCLALVYIYRMATERKLLIFESQTKHHYFFYFFFFWYALSIIWSIEVVYSVKYLFYIFVGSFLSLSIIFFLDNQQEQSRAYKILSIIFMFEIIICLLEILTDFRLPVSPFSDNVKYFEREIAYDKNADPRAIAYIMSLPTGFQWNPNNLSVVMNIIFPFALFQKKKYIKYSMIFSLSFIIISSGSRGNLIAMLFITFVFFIMYSSKKRIKEVVLDIIIVPLIIYIAYINPFQIIKDQFKSQYCEADILASEVIEIKKSESGVILLALNKYLNMLLYGEDIINSSLGKRIQLVRNGLMSFREHWIFGVGGGGSIAVQERAEKKAGKLLSMHNFWVEMLVDAGILFIIVFFSWYLSIIIKLYRITLSKTNENDHYYASACSLAMAGFLISAVSASSVIYLLPMWILFGFSIATINIYEKNKDEITFTC